MPETSFQTKLLPSSHALEALPLLEAGHPVALPTETVYGLAANALDPEAVARVFAAKKRPSFDPLIVHLPEVDWLERVADMPGPLLTIAHSLITAFWPGPLTLVLPKKELLCDLVTSGLPTVAVRMSAHPVFQQVCRAFGSPLAAPSANRFGRVSPTLASHVMEELGGRIPAVVDGGACAFGIESTIVKLREDGAIEVLRPGPITTDQLQELAPVLETKSKPPGGTESIESPGQLASHYAPATKLRLLEQVFEAEALASDGRAFLAWDEESAEAAGAKFAHVEVLAPGGNAILGASRLFKLLRELDAMGLDEIIALRPPPDGLGLAIGDRLARASATKQDFH